MLDREQSACPGISPRGFSSSVFKRCSASQLPVGEIHTFNKLNSKYYIPKGTVPNSVLHLLQHLAKIVQVV